METLHFTNVIANKNVVRGYDCGDISTVCSIFTDDANLFREIKCKKKSYLNV